MTDHAQDQRRQFILSRDRYGRAKYAIKRWYHGIGPLIVLLVLILAFVQTMEYNEKLEIERLRADKATERAQRLENWNRIISSQGKFLFLIEADSPEELERKLTDVRNYASDAKIHSQAARGK